MATAARERLAQLLSDPPAGSFSAQLLAPALLLQLHVAGVGPVRLPVRAPVAEKLIAVALPALFGRGEQTLSDTGVRDTWELTSDQVTLGGPGWSGMLARAQEYFRDELGLPRTTRLRAELHAMLVYETGQFFLRHQDSEKDDTMVATMVVSLPSAHTGGELVVEHAGQSTAYRASSTELDFVAFYADCRHQVTPVKSGHRVALTFNLLAEAEQPAEQPAAEADAELARCLTEHFTTPFNSWHRNAEPLRPGRLVFLLDHEYTERGLSWNRLKGVDAKRVARLRAAAQLAGYELVLALAEVKETRDARFPGRRDYDHYNDREADQNLDELVVGELVADEITLGWLTGPDGTGGEPVSLDVPNHEVCTATPSAVLTPYESAYEGYTGNFGNTLDRWYRRAAVVAWPKDQTFAALARARPLWALHEIHDCIYDTDLDGARAEAQSLAQFWSTAGAQPGLLGAALEVAADLGVVETATLLVEPFSMQALTQEHAGALAAAAERYGEGWTRAVVDGWFGPVRYAGIELLDWIGNGLPGLCATLRAAGKPELAALLADGAWRRLHHELETTDARTRDRRSRLERLSAPMAGLLESADDTLRDEVIAALRAFGDHMLECLMPALRLADARRVPGLDTIARDCAQRLRVILGRVQRAADDWSIEWTGCGCDLCDTLAAFLGSPTQRAFTWPLSTRERQHVHTMIDAAGLPVLHQTQRQARPIALLVTKTDDLITDIVDARRRAETDLSWLTSTLGAGADPDA
jgi:hypothetical protein